MVIRYTCSIMKALLGQHGAGSSQVLVAYFELFGNSSKNDIKFSSPEVGSLTASVGMPYSTAHLFSYCLKKGQMVNGLAFL